MKHMKLLYLTMIIAVCPLLAAPGGSGGGDPRAARAINFGQQFVAWLLAHPHPGVDIDATTMLENIEYFSKSLDTKTPFLRMQPTNEVLCFGAYKEACANADHTIDMAGQYWEAATTTDQDRCTVASTEFARPQNIDKLYEKILSVCQEVYPKATTKLANIVVQDQNTECVIIAQDATWDPSACPAKLAITVYLHDVNRTILSPPNPEVGHWYIKYDSCKTKAPVPMGTNAYKSAKAVADSLVSKGRCFMTDDQVANPP